MKKLLIPCCLVLLAGCVDKDYDKEIDMNVTIAENGIAISVGSISGAKPLLWSMITLFIAANSVLESVDSEM